MLRRLHLRPQPQITLIFHPRLQLRVQRLKPLPMLRRFREVVQFMRVRLQIEELELRPVLVPLVERPRPSVRLAALPPREVEAVAVLLGDQIREPVLVRDVPDQLVAFVVRVRRDFVGM